MKTSRVVRSGNLVGVGQSGPPPEDLRTYETVDSTPTTALVRPAGSVAHRRDGTAAWLAAKIAGVTQWISVSILYTLAAAYTQIVAIVGAYVAGWRPGVVVYDASVNATSVVVGGLSSAKIYRLEVQADINGYSDWLEILPNGSSSNCGSHVEQDHGGMIAGTAHLYVGSIFASGSGSTSRRWTGVLGPRIGGMSSWRCTGKTANNVALGEAYLVVGATTTDFTSLTVLFNNTAARTGWLRIIEETP